MSNGKCDTVFYNAKIVTVDESFSIAEAVAIGNGKFLKVGRKADVCSLADPETKQIDLQGKMVVPGFMDAHPHVIIAGERREIYLSLKGLDSIDAIKDRIAEKVKVTAPDKWIVTSPIGRPPDYFFVPEGLNERRWPTCWDLDEVSPNNPVCISTHFQRPHPIILNNSGLRLLGVTKETPSEDGGVQIVKDEVTGDPNGQFHGMHLWSLSPLYMKLMEILPKSTFEQTIDGLSASIRDFNVVGVTTSYEGHGTTPERLLPCKELWYRNQLTMRFCFAYEIDPKNSLDEVETLMKVSAHATGPGFGNDFIKICGMTISIDGPSPLGLALMNKPYSDPFGKIGTGVQKISAEKLNEIALLAAEHDLRLNIQAAGDKAIDIALDAFENADKEISIRDRRWVLQHCQFPSKDNVNKAKQLGIFVTTGSNFEYSEGAEVYVRRLGEDYCVRAMPLRWWLDSDVVVTQSTDGKHYDPMFTLWQSLKRIDGLTGDSLMTPSKEISRQEALRMHTKNCAQLLFWEDKLGSIEAGKLADLVVLDHDILTCPVDEIKDTRVLMTMVDGRVVYEGGG